MQIVDILVVALLVLGASAYLYKTFKPKSTSSGCGCTTMDCKVPKPKIKKP